MTKPKPRPKPETPDEWWARVKREHGPPPQRLVDHVRRLRRETADRAAAHSPRKGDAA